MTDKQYNLRRMVEEDLGAKLSWLVAAALFHFGWDWLGYAFVCFGCAEMVNSLSYCLAAKKGE